MKKLIATATIAGLLTVGGASAAFAAGSDGGSGITSITTGQSKPASPNDGRHGARRHLRRVALRTAAEAAAKAIGVDVAALRVAFRSGSSIADLAQSKGVELSKVTDAIVQALTDKIDQAVKDGKVPADKAAKVKARLPHLVDRLVNRKPGARAQGGRQTPPAA